MKEISPLLAAHLQSEVMTLAWCWKITRADGLELGFTTLDYSLEIDRLTYKASTGFFPNAVSTNQNLTVDNSELNSILDDESITELDLWAGRYDYAVVDLFLVNYSQTTVNGEPSTLPVLTGYLGEVRHDDRGFTAELRSKTDLLNQKIIDQTSPGCRNEFGDSGCKLNLAPLSHEFDLRAVTDNRLFTVAALGLRQGYFNQGELTFLSGENEGLTFTIQTYNSQTQILSLFETPPFRVQRGDRVRAVAGCDRSRANCIFWDNILNFRGEPDLPGADKVLSGFD